MDEPFEDFLHRAAYSFTNVPPPDMEKPPGQREIFALCWFEDGVESHDVVFWEV